MKSFALRSLCSFLLFLPTTAVAAAERAAQAVSGTAAQAVAGTNALAHKESLFSWGSYFQALAVLFLLVALLWAAVWYLKNKGALRLLSAQGDLAVENRLPLGPKKSLVVVRFLNKRMLLGVTDHQITMLTELPTDESTDTIPPVPHAGNLPFETRLREAVGTDAHTP